MFEPIDGAPDGVLAFKAVGQVEASDYEQVLTPAIEAATSGGAKDRIVIGSCSSPSPRAYRPAPRGRT